MMMNLMPLRYSITSWEQALDCKSNTSPDIRIGVAKIEDRVLDARIVSVEHISYGTLFAAVVSGDGIIVSDCDIDGNPITWMSTEEVLAQLARFGFYIKFNEPGNLPGKMLTYLMTLDNIGFQHISRIVVKSEDGSARIATIAFQGSANPRWLTYPCEISRAELMRAASQGTAFDVSAVTKGMFEPDDWSWLTFVANIKDVIRDNK